MADAQHIDEEGAVPLQHQVIYCGVRDTKSLDQQYPPSNIPARLGVDIAKYKKRSLVDAPNDSCNERQLLVRPSIGVGAAEIL